jgi:NAD(P)-dependent dehydrogenase (short-subunit alcohol dehydrogenase family)
MSEKSLPLKGRTALVTGAAKRIGRAVALALAEAGADVIVHCRGSRGEAEATASLIRRGGRQAWCVQADLGEPDQAGALLARAAEAAAGPVDILINNASTFTDDTVMDFTPQSLLASVQLHAMAPLVLSRALAAQRIPAGDIVNFLDSRMEDYDRRHASYHLGKRMLWTITRMLATELAPAIKVNAVAPGLILPPKGKDEQYLAGLAHTNPLNRVGSVEGVAAAVLLLVESDFITGQVIHVDGGRHIRGNFYG